MRADGTAHLHASPRTTLAVAERDDEAIALAAHRRGDAAVLEPAVREVAENRSLARLLRHRAMERAVPARVVIGVARAARVRADVAQRASVGRRAQVARRRARRGDSERNRED